MQSSCADNAERRANRRGAAPARRAGRYPSNVAAPRLPHKHSRGDPPPVPPLTETVRATADPRGRPGQSQQTQSQQTQGRQTQSQQTKRKQPQHQETQPVTEPADSSYSAKHLS